MLYVYLAYPSAKNMAAACSAEAQADCQLNTRRYIKEDRTPQQRYISGSNSGYFEL
jgi:hypothetical protein